VGRKSGRFFEKKLRKKLLINFGYGGPTGTAIQESKVFCFFFLKKKRFLSP